MQRRLNDSEEALIIAAYTRGEDPWEIAPRFNIHRNTIYSVLERHGIELRRKKRQFLSPAQMERVKQLYEAGHSFQEVAEKMGVSWRTAQKYSRRTGVVARPAGFRNGEEHHGWKGGRTLTESGYVLILIHPGDPFFEMGHEKVPNCRYVLEHRLVVARALGRLLRDDETVHHIDNDPTNNELSNLQLRSGKHGKGAVAQCSDCGSHDIIFVPLASPEKN